MMPFLIPITISITFIIACAWVISLIIAAYRHPANLRAQTDFHNRMLEKFSSADEFAAYLESDAGKNFFGSLGSEPATPLRKILGSIQSGAVLTLLGIGLFILGNLFNAQDGGNVMLVCGVASFAIGAGFLISAAISYRLAKTWNLIPSNNARADSSETASSVV